MEDLRKLTHIEKTELAYALAMAKRRNRIYANSIDEMPKEKVNTGNQLYSKSERDALQIAIEVDEDLLNRVVNNEIYVSDGVMNALISERKV